MFQKLLLALFLSFGFLNASHETLRIGYIDSYYDNKITRSQLEEIIKDIEQNFESTLGYDVFDLNKQGKPIDLVYMPPSKSKMTIKELTRKLKNKKIKIEKLQEQLSSKQGYMKETQKKLRGEADKVNREIRELNRYINRANQKKIADRYEYNRINAYIKKERKNIFHLQDRFEQKRLKFNDFLSAYRQKISLYKSEINRFNRLQRKLEILSRSTKEIKGAAIGYKKVVFKTFDENGETVHRKVEENYMEKIEIYGFKSLAQLKAILAHEIAHMVGVGHVNSRGALMNPVLQRNQIGNLQLTWEDIRAFEEGF